MAALTTYSQFSGAVGLSNTDPSKPEGQQLINFIEKYEAEFLRTFLGYELYQLFIAGLDANEAKYEAIRDGVEYTAASGELVKWDGLLGNYGTPVVNYIYFHLLNHKRTSSGNIGEVVPNMENGTVVSPYLKQVRAWNEMVDQCWLLHEFLRINEADYPEYIGLVSSPYYPGSGAANVELFTPINEFNI